MLLMTMLLMAAAPSTHAARPRHPVRIVHVARVRHGHRGRRPITMSLRKFRSNDCGSDAICVTAMPQNRYRLPLPDIAGPSDKDMALAEDGTRCALIGQTICPHRAHTLVHLGDAAPGIPASAVIR